MTTTDQPAEPIRIPARDLRDGDVITMGTIKTATIPPSKSYVSITFESKIGTHGTAFPLDLEVLVLTRAGQQPVTLADAITGLTQLAETFEAREKLLWAEDAGPVKLARGEAYGFCAADVRALLARLQA